MKVWKVDNYCVPEITDLERVLNIYEKQGATIRQIITHTDTNGESFLNFAVVYTIEDDSRDYGV